MKGAEAIVRSLESEGVKHIFGILGGAIMEVYDVFYDKSEIRHILMRHEQCAAHAAEGYARVSGRVGVCMATSGPGATNLVTGIADAYMDSTPLVAFTGQVPVSLIGNDAFQEADIIGITMPITKHNFQITDPDEIPRTIKAAFKIASTRRPGPVLVDLPKDIQQAELKKKFEYPEDVELPGYKVVKSGGHPQQLKEVAKALMNAERPVIIAGGGVILANASRELLELAESLAIPVATTLMGKGSFPENHPLALGMAGMHGRKVANLAITESDLLIAIGVRFSDRITGNVKYFATNAKKIHIDIDPSEIGKNVDVDIPIVGDAKLVIRNLIKIVNKLKTKKRTKWNEKIKRWRKEFPLRYDYDDVPIKQQRVMKELNEIIDDKTIITTEVGQCQMWAAHYLNINNPRTFISSGGLGTMGFGFPAAIGAKVAKPDYKVIDVGSEGSFMMTGQDLATCVKEDIPVVVVLLDNRYLGMVKQWQDLFYGKRRSHTYLGDIPDFVKYAEAFKAKGIYVERPSEIRDALLEAVKSNEPFVVDIRVDPDEHILPMIQPGGRLDKMIDREDV
ncbi:MAG: acetolactate synthase large subunit [Candidatus Altiarchaeales archaeon]|nr:MAG: acetolactate synthase large subunit [Candidatus Altiarchaeales archaeon]RLI94088.1 MAG: acetolactate synthase large subunit [Candidatus Altiarchaeales archaeon]HDO82631.1 acetolactate synthase large subunit [Candidatus Altiarchaeales archaeon]HEX55280.1 acetolactate synthase large subunit [Candidatus Altiarchaeales archaeon]